MNKLSNTELGEEPNLTPSSPRPPTSPKGREKNNSELNPKGKLLNFSNENSLLAKAEMFFENLPILLTVEEASELLRVSVATIYDWNHQGILPKDVILKINGRLRIRTKALESWISLQNSF